MSDRHQPRVHRAPTGNAPAGDPPSKVCPTCGRRFEWRAKWSRQWDDIRYCSAACRRGLRSIDHELERAIVELLGTRARSATICPSEAARAVGGDTWRTEMEAARRAGRRLVAAGVVEITQGGQVVDPSSAKGPIRLRLVRRPEPPVDDRVV